MQSSKGRPSVTVVSVAPEQDALSLWEPLCQKLQPASLQAVLLLPEQYHFIDASEGMFQLSMISSIIKQVSYKALYMQKLHVSACWQSPWTQLHPCQGSDRQHQSKY